jgi:DNA-directed RNA polymerase alpha subunit
VILLYKEQLINIPRRAFYLSVAVSDSERSVINFFVAGMESIEIEIRHEPIEGREHWRKCGDLARSIAMLAASADAYEVTPELRIKRIGAEIDDNVIKARFSVRTRKAMNRLGINTIGDLTSKTADELISVRGFGTFSLEEVRQKLSEMGLSLRGE